MAPSRQVEPDVCRRSGSSASTGVRSSVIGVVLSGVLVVGGVATGSEAAPAANACDVGASQARLVHARHLATALQLDHPTDPRQIELARDLHALGVTPAVSTGWHQQAIDVSDHLLGTTDPTLRQVAIALARSGVGPTPADLGRDDPSGPVQDLLNGADQPLDAVSDAVTAAAQAAGALLSPPPAAQTSTSTTQRAGDGWMPRPRVEPPRACSESGNGITDRETSSNQHTGDEPDPTASSGPRATTGEQPSESSSPTATGATTSTVSEARTAGSTTGDPDESGSVTPTSASDPANPGDPVLDDTAPATPSSGPTATGSKDPSSSEELRDAADAVQAIADLLRSLAAQSSPDAEQLADEISRLLPQLRPVADDPSRTSPVPDSPAPVSSRQPSPTTQPSGTWAPASPSPSRTDESAGQNPPDPNASDEDPSAGDWESQADELADQAQQAASTDPLARELASTLDDAGFGGGGASATRTDEPVASSTREPDPTRQEPGDPATDLPEGGSSDPTTPEPTTSSGLSTSNSSGSAPPSDTAPPDRPASSTDASPSGPADGEVSPATWDRLAECESSGDWAADTGNGYAGGLQFDPATWAAFGGSNSPAGASRAEQMAVAQKVKDAQGWSAWPSCSAKLGLR